MQPIKQLERYSVQEFEDKDSVGHSSIWWFDTTPSSTILPDWGEHARDRALRNLYRNHYNWIGQAAVAALIRKVKQVPYTISAGRNNATYYQKLLNNAHFNRGWGEFLSRFLLDYLTCDYGAYWELIGRGNPKSVIRGRVMGISALDSLRCVPTGNNEFPVVYYSRISGQMHRLHHTRVIRLVDMPDGDESRHMAGLCALSRAVAMIEQQIPMQKYVASTMDEMPPIGIFYNNAAMNDDQWQMAWRQYKASRMRGNTGFLTLNNGSLNGEIKGSFLPFAAAPDKFDYNTYTEIAVNAFSAAFGIDRQDIWPLTGKMAGTATQSEILAEKSRGMAFGDMLTTIERAFNNYVLPADVEFSFEYRDEEKDKQVADKDAVLLANAAQLNSIGVPTEVVIRYLANNSEQFNDVLTDDAGEIIELPDDDIKPNPVPPQFVEAEEIEDEDVQVDDNVDTSGEDAIRRLEKSAKALEENKREFIQRFKAIQEDLRDGNLDRRRAGIILRGLLNTYGVRLFSDGLEDGGVDSSELSGKDRQTIDRILKEQSPYVSKFTNELVNGNGITDVQAEQRAVMWFNKSCDPFYRAGLRSADANAMYEWRLGPTEHCSTCKQLSGQRHRLRVFVDAGWHPRSGNLECGGFLCQCQLVKTRKSATGRLPRSASPTR